jgi:hypothetical protein
MRIHRPIVTFLVLIGAVGTARAADALPDRYLDASHYVQVTVADPYVEMRTGPGRGYPVTRVVPRGERVDVLMRRTDWFELRDDTGRKGWVDRAQMEQTVLANGEKLRFEDTRRRDYDLTPWEVGFQSGNFGGGNVNSAYLGYAFNDNLSIELGTAQALGSSSNNIFGTVGLTHIFRPDWRFAPFVDLGTGIVKIEPRATIVQPPNRTEQVGYWGAGMKVFLSHRLLFRADYRSYVIFTKSAENEDRNEWKVGFAFFF